ncbi:TAT-variant-translocated molybdopterin oxidoreductase [Opitutus sp. ER46]|uniref:TAT-variant-translocated molybdopterin oxidoreductase n=1 Tax=Opitutus sp. ER46 TaxID=2161864 RepID=UPI000D30D89E|nr:TAT-variant-translocated molybdopterin oxidoreductase [Opitutus sp. ER46]PTX92619.1 hydrogenase [Opitutus sp. ER46]
MKRKIDHPAPSAREMNGPKYWRSLDELAQTPGFQDQLHREFPEGASTLDGVDRRAFMKIMAASFALGGVGLAGCRRPERNILPFGKSVDGVIPGLPQYYATAMPLRRAAVPLLAETHQGRPTKLEGNPTYAPFGGRTSITAQASVLDLYDPDRAKAHTSSGVTISTDAVNALLAEISRKFAAGQGAGLAILAEESASPTRARLLQRLRERFPQAIWAEYEPVADEPPLAAAQAAFGVNVKPVYHFAKAKRILSIDGDFLQAEAGSVYYARGYADGRRLGSAKDDMNRLYVAESAMTLTGSMADHRLRLASSHMLGFASAIALALHDRMPGAEILQPFTEGLTVKPEWITACADDLRAHAGSCLVVAGSHLPAAVHAITYGINLALGNVGHTVDFVTVPASSAASIQDLARAIQEKRVQTLVVLGGNPVYNAPADLDWPALQKSVPQVVRFGGYVDETSALAGTHVAAAHYLESWGDARTADGTIVPVQPMILPLFGGLTELEVLARLGGETNADPYELVRATIAGLAGGDADKAMRRFLHDGLLANSAYPVANVRFDVDRAGSLLQGLGRAPVVDAAHLEVRFVADHKVDDGRFANNGWLQEVSDPITKIAWDNAILVSPALARELGVYPKGSALQIARVEEGELDSMAREQARIGELVLGGRKVRGPIHIQPGLANHTVVVTLGYGRTKSGHIGTNSGYNAYPLRTSTAMHVANGATLTVTAERHALANTQAHWSMEGRDLVREANLDEYQRNPGFVAAIGLEAHSPSILGEAGEKMSLQERATEIPRGGSLYQTPNKQNDGFDGVHQWGMSIDLNTCIGCNACVVACQAENNIPIVGRDQSLRGRQMHWIRIDRYYSDGEIDAAAFGGEGNKQLPEDPQISLQPVGCQHCELAPCETVCPVNATVHDNEGLNTMAYNRCIGTRYCANNCPYKVRRFNYFDWNQRQLDSLYLGPLGPKGMPELVKMVKNPEVSVRMRGVMEKCTYCVQRVQNGKIQHKVRMAQAGTPEQVMVPDGTVVPACAQTCPVDAIVFGNLLDPHSAVVKAKAREQEYSLLGYLNIRPRTTYAARIRNPNPRMPDYGKLPLSRIEQSRKNEPAAAGAHGAAAGHTAPHHAQPADAHAAAPQH